MLTYLKTSWHILLALVVGAVCIFGVGFYLGGTWTAPTQQEHVTEAIPSEEIVTNETVLEAYFFGIHEEVVQPDGTVCHVFVVKEGTESVIAYYKDLIVEVGNTMQSLTPTGELRINLPWNDMPEYAKEAFLSRGEMGITLIKRAETGKGANVCDSFFAFGNLN